MGEGDKVWNKIQLDSLKSHFEVIVCTKGTRREVVYRVGRDLGHFCHLIV